MIPFFYMESTPVSWSMSTNMLIAEDSEKWNELWEEHMIFEKHDEFKLHHPRMDRIRLERIIQDMRIQIRQLTNSLNPNTLIH